MISRLNEVEREIADLSAEREKLRDALGYNDVKYIDHVQGTDGAEYKCKKCGKGWIMQKQMPCPICHPEAYPPKVPSNEKITGAGFSASR